MIEYDTFLYAYGITACVVSCIGVFFILRGMVQGELEPNRASWWMWSVIGMCVAVTYYATGARENMFIFVPYTLGCLTVAIFSVRHGTGGWSPFERWCIAGSLASLIPWIVFHEVDTSYVLEVIAAVFAAIPTFRQAWQHPEKESPLVWTCFAAGNAINMLAIREYTWQATLYPAWCAGSSAVILLMVWLPYQRNKPAYFSET